MKNPSTSPDACPDWCDGITVTNVRHGDPMCDYRRCCHGAQLKKLHRKMSPKQIRADVLATIKNRPK
jgi:hypothetical protein